MKQKLTVITVILLAVLAISVLIWTRPVQGVDPNPSGQSTVTLPPSTDSPWTVEEQKIIEVLNRERKVMLEAEYTFDTSKFATVYINDPRGAKLPSYVLDKIREIRKDPTIRKDQIGVLTYRQVLIEEQKQDYDNYIAGLRTKKAKGSINQEELRILDGETNGWPTPEPAAQSEAFKAPRCLTKSLSRDHPAPPYPMPELTSTPENNMDIVVTPFCGPSPTPTEPIIPWVRHRGQNPATIPSIHFEVQIKSITIEGDIARVVVYADGFPQYTLVKVNGKWYIA